MIAFLSHVAYEFRAGLRDRARLFLFYLFPLVFALLMGAMMVPLNPSFLERMVPALSVFVMMCLGFLSLPSSMVTARNTGIWRSYKINGVPRWALLTAPPVAMALHAALASALVATVVHLGFGAPLPTDPGRFVVVWGVSWVGVSAVGCVIGTVSANERVSLLLSQLFFIPSFLLGGMTVPDQALPPTLRPLSWIFPATHAMQAFTGGPLWFPLVLLLGVALVGWLVTFGRFRWEAKA